MKIAIIGGGIAGLALALNFHRRGLSCRVYERASTIKELGVGITILPHCMREFAQLGLQESVVEAGIVTAESRFFNRFGQLIYSEPRGAAAGYAFPEVGLPRGRLHVLLYQAVCDRLGPDAVVTNRACVRVEQDAGGARAYFVETDSGAPAPSEVCDVLAACDGVNSSVRKQFYPEEKTAFGGINTWRGTTWRAPILGGRVYMRIGSIRTGKLVIYPIVEEGTGRQLINWMAEIEGTGAERNDWNEPGRLADFLSVYESWRFPWLDVPDLLAKSEQILEYPMVDKDPVAHWTFGRVTFVGDAAHPMYPRGSNGAAQAAIDARTLADKLAASQGDPLAALAAYEAERLPAANRVVLTNRANPPDAINIKVEELVGDRPFDDLAKYISQDELRAMSDAYKSVAGFARSDDV